MREIDELKTKVVNALAKAKFVSANSTELIAALSPVLGFQLDSAADTARRGLDARSFLGGRPLAPRNLKWPEGDHGPLAFLGQICFDECKALDFEGRLPETGIAYFFAAYDEDAIAYDDILPSKVIYLAAPEELVEVEAPAFEDPADAVFKKAAMRFRLGFKTDLDLLGDPRDCEIYDAAVAPHFGDWSGYLLGDLLYCEAFELDRDTQTLLLHLAAFTLVRDQAGDDSSTYASSCLDFVISHEALANKDFDETELWFDYFR